eukprot:TRINITY_DN8853_c0_g1_i3.p1 TRINITY_DN8853_c0_g1~~TRINITY_DN8853_c0_g1_i3.p1  ORF type:complete len:379 (-),score=37.06 TRINITY_DN8853_c0_g1_i3:49-1185(-)
MATLSTGVDASQTKSEDGRSRQSSQSDCSATRECFKNSVVESVVSSHFDTVWQQQPPRLIKYRPGHLHAYGWIPFINMRNLSATVFGSTTLHVQSLVLIGWTLLLHLTGLGLPEEDLKSFSLVFGTPYLGAIFNGCMVVTFLLGMFASLVYNRWWAIRQAYAKINSITVDLALIIANQIKPYLSQQRQDASLELVRLLNLGHVLMLQSCDQESLEFRELNILAKRRRQGSLSREEPGLFSNRFKYVEYEDLCAVGLINQDEWDKIQKQQQLGLEPYLTVYYWAQNFATKCQEKGLLTNSSGITSKIGSIVESASSIFTFIRTQMPYPYVHLVSMMVHIYLLFIASYVGLFLHIGFPNDRMTQSICRRAKGEKIGRAHV